MNDDEQDVVIEEPKKAGEVKTAEEWAAFRGHTPEFKRPAPPKDKPKKVMRPVHNPLFRHYQEARLLHTWPIGKELTLAEYDAAVQAAKDHVYR